MSQVKVQKTSGRFSAGHLTDPQPGYQRYEKFDDAMNAACDRSKDDDVWADGTSTMRRQAARQ